ncbi:MAG TPA: site-2 protease family protein [Gemmataceae bacterium]|nr:site-2 protease family protein [Gemmataceae bacterium]
MDLTTSLNNPAERRKQVRLKVRPDLQVFEQKYEGKLYHVVKDPVCLRYYRFNKQEYFVFHLFDGEHTMEEVQQAFEEEFTPQRLEHNDLEGFARQLVTAGLVQNEQPGAGKHLFTRRAKQRRLKRFAAFTNILYLKIPIFDPDRILTWLYKRLWWIFTYTFFAASVAFMLAAIVHVTLHFDTFYAKLPAYQEFFTWNSVLYMWLSLGVVKVIHEFGHGLSCKAFGGECHEMGVLLMCLSPALYANVTDAWTLADKWKRIIISFAGIYVELVIAAAATFVWWYTPAYPVVNNIALCIMVLCSVSTIVFNANPLMRFDGYYILSDWLEIPNLREKANRYLNNTFLEKCLGVEVPPEAYMAPGRKVLFVVYAVTSWVYKWVIMFGILWFLADFLGPKLKILSQMLAILSLASMFIWPGYRAIKNVRQRGRLPDMKKARVYVTLAVFAGLIAAVFLAPLPVSRVHEAGLVVMDPDAVEPVAVAASARMTSLEVSPGQWVKKGQVLARFSSAEMNQDLTKETSELQQHREEAAMLAETVRQFRGLGVPVLRLERVQEDARNAESSARAKEVSVGLASEQLKRVNELVAPRDGYVVTVPKREDVGRLYKVEDPESQRVFAIGDPTRLIVKIPISPQDKRVLEEDMPARGELDVSIYVKGRSDTAFTGKLRRLPKQNAATVPIQLTQRGGGPLAVKPAEDPNMLIPLAQTYVVEVELTDPNATIKPGQLAVVKIHAKWRSSAWWVGKTLANALDIGFY